jgi:ABC-type uncharacterized transport system substrate-binding protein
MRTHILRIAAAAMAALSLTVAGASAHPHVWVTMRSQVIFAPDGTITAVRHAWTFDDMFTAFALQGIESKKRGVYTREELAPLAKTNVESLKEFEYFTAAKIDGKSVEFSDPTGDYHLDYKNEVLTLHMTVPLKKPVKARNVSIEVYDPSYFVDFSFEKDNAVTLVGAPAGCKLALGRPEEMDPGLAAKLFQMAPDQKLDPSQFLGAQFANRIIVSCP